MGKPLDRSDRKSERLKTMMLVAFGQKKMFQNLLPAVLHFFIYAAFLITSTELFEIIFDGLSGNHRFFADSLGLFYVIVISTIEILSILAFVATIIFLARRNLLKLSRFHMDEMTGWPKLDGNIILYLEIILIFCIFTMNGTDEVMLNNGWSHANVNADSFGFAVSSYLGPFVFGGLDRDTLSILERIGWWGHLTMVLGFLNYLPYSKHFHIILAFPNTYYSNLNSKGQLTNLSNVKKEVENNMQDCDNSDYPVDAPQFEEIGSDKFLLQDSGIKIADIKIGDGASPYEFDEVELHYTGWLMNGCVFDSSFSRKESSQFPVDGVIQGFKEAILGMNVNGIRRVEIPPELGYGERGAGNTIPPYATLVFHIELIAIK